VRANIAEKTLQTQPSDERHPTNTRQASGFKCAWSFVAVVIGCSENGSLMIHGIKEDSDACSIEILVQTVDITGVPIIGGFSSSLV